MSICIFNTVKRNNSRSLIVENESGNDGVYLDPFVFLKIVHWTIYVLYWSESSLTILFVISSLFLSHSFATQHPCLGPSYYSLPMSLFFVYGLTSFLHSTFLVPFSVIPFPLSFTCSGFYPYSIHISSSFFQLHLNLLLFFTVLNYILSTYPWFSVSGKIPYSSVNLNWVSLPSVTSQNSSYHSTQTKDTKSLVKPTIHLLYTTSILVGIHVRCDS